MKIKNIVLCMLLVCSLFGTAYAGPVVHRDGVIIPTGAVLDIVGINDGSFPYMRPAGAGFGTSPLRTDGIDVTNYGRFTTTSFTTPYQQTLTVAKSGGDYTTIQAAINSIIDATTTKRYCIKVEPGDYAEVVTMKNYVDIIGSGRTNSRITGTSGTILTFPATKATIQDMGIYVNYGALGANSVAVVSAGADSVMLRCDITVTKSSGDFTMKTISVTGGAFRMLDSYHYYSITGATTDSALLQTAISQTGSLTTMLIYNSEITITCNDTNDQVIGFETLTGSAGTYLLLNNIVNVTSSGANGTATGLWLYGTATGATATQNRFVISAPGSAWGFYIDSTAGGAVVNTSHNDVTVTSSGTAASCNVDTGDTWNSTFDRITAASGYAGGGTINFLSSESAGNLTVTGIMTAGILGIGTSTPATKLNVAGAIMNTGPAAVTSFAGTVSSSGTSITFSAAADAILAGYSATNPVIGTTIIAATQTRYIASWTNATTAVVGTAPSPAWSGDTITSVQLPISVAKKSDGTAGVVVNAAGNVGIGTTSPTNLFHVSRAGNANADFQSTGGGDFGVNIKSGSTAGENPWLRFYRGNNIKYTLDVDDSDGLRFKWDGATSALYLEDGGDVGVGTTSPITKLHQAQFSADAVGSYHTFSKSRHATQDSHTIVQDNDPIGGINFAPSDGTDFGTISAQILAEVDDAAPAASSIGGALVFKTAAGAGADDLSERVRIDHNGIVYMPAVAVHDIAGDDNETPLYIDPDDGEMGYSSSIAASKANIEPLTDASWIYDLTPRQYNRKVILENAHWEQLFDEIEITEEEAFDLQPAKEEGQEPVKSLKQNVRYENGKYYLRIPTGKRFIPAIYSDTEFSEKIETGLIAEEVYAVKPNAVFSVDGHLMGVRYDQLITPLLTELLKLKKRVDQLEKRVEELENK
jgi:hypothetical protein